MSKKIKFGLGFIILAIIPVIFGLKKTSAVMCLNDDKFCIMNRLYDCEGRIGGTPLVDDCPGSCDDSDVNYVHCAF